MRLCKRKLKSLIFLIIIGAVLTFFIVSGKTPCFNFNIINESVASRLIGESMSAFYTSAEKDSELFKKLAFGFDISEPVSIIKSNLLVFAAAKEPEKLVPKEPEPDLTDAKPIKEMSIEGSLNNSVKVKNATSYTFNTAELLSEPLSFGFNTSGPLVLIVHSHSSESYTATDKNYYLPTDPDRTEDINYNVVRVGSELAKTLEKKGISSLHDTSLHDYPSYNGSYKSSLASVEGYLEKYPSIRLVLDIHRDSMVQADGTKLKLVAEIENKKAAQIMLLTGSDQGGLYHPEWRENLKFAIKLQQVINKMYPTLARPVSFTKERYNTHTTKGSIIVEVGTTGNTLEEALVSAEMLGNAVYEFIKTN